MEREVEELKQLVRRNIELTKETHDIVEGMRRSNRRSTVLRWGWRLFIFGAALFGYYYFVWPYVQQAQALYSSIQSGAAEAQGFGSQLMDFFKNFGQ